MPFGSKKTPFLVAFSPHHHKQLLFSILWQQKALPLGKSTVRVFFPEQGKILPFPQEKNMYRESWCLERGPGPLLKQLRWVLVLTSIKKQFRLGWQTPAFTVKRGLALAAATFALARSWTTKFSTCIGGGFNHREQWQLQPQRASTHSGLFTLNTLLQNIMSSVYVLIIVKCLCH